MRLLEGHIAPDESEASIVDELREDIRRLKHDLMQSQREVATAKRESAHAIGNLRKLLKPWYQALQMIYGEMDAGGVDEAPTASGPVDARVSAVWQNWKQKIGGQAAQIIDAMLLHGGMSAQQIALAIGIHRKNVPQLIHKLNKAGLIDKNGGIFSLKKL